MRSLMTRAFPKNSIFGGGFLQRNGRGTSNIEETEDYYNWHVDMPGVGEDNINVEYNGQSDVVTVSTSYEDSDKDLHRRRSYSRTVKIGGSQVDPAGISASYEDGVLTVRFPKTEDERVTRQIEIT